MRSYVIIGNGVAGTTAAEHIAKYDDSGEITILTEEDLPFYSRIRLIEYIAGEITEEDLIIRKTAWYDDRNIKLKLNARVTEAIPDQNIVITADNSRFTYDRLLIASGSHSFIPPIAGADKSGVLSLRNIQDAREINNAAENIQHVVVIGGGLLGLETGNALRKKGKNVTIVEFFPRLLPRQLDVDGARRLQDIMEGMGFSFRLDAKTEKIEGDKTAEGVRLEGGEVLPCDMVIISAGVRPNMELANIFNLEADKGIKVDERMRTGRANIYAAGDVIEFNNIFYGIWPASMEQGKIAGSNMAGEDTVYQGTVMSNTLKVVGIDLSAAGNIDVDNVFESKIVTEAGIYKKLVLDDNRIIGCIMLGDNKGFNKITRAMSEKTDVSKIKDLVLTEAFDFNKL